MRRRILQRKKMLDKDFGMWWELKEQVENE